MKQIVIFIGLLTMSACAGTARLSKDGQKEKAFVAEVVRIMQDGSKDWLLKNYISPKYCKENEIDLSQLFVNTFSVVGFETESYDPGTGEVKVLIWGENKLWMHRLYFKVVKEGDKLYLYPGAISEEYLDPWTDSDRYLEDKGL